MAGRNQTCPYCMSVIKPGTAVTVCPVDGIAHHSDCWRENGGCTIYGCPAGPFSATHEAVRTPSGAVGTRRGPRRAPMLVFGILIVIVSLGATGISIHQCREAAVQRRAAEQAERKAEQHRQQAEQAREEAELERKRAHPVSLLESGVTIRQPKLDEDRTTYKGLGYPRRRFWVYAVISNNLHGIEDQVISYQCVLRGPGGLEPYGSDEETVSLTDSQYLISVWYFMKDGSSRPMGDYQYAMRINGEVMAEGSFSIP